MNKNLCHRHSGMILALGASESFREIADALKDVDRWFPELVPPLDTIFRGHPRV